MKLEQGSVASTMTRAHNIVKVAPAEQQAEAKELVLEGEAQADVPFK